MSTIMAFAMYKPRPGKESELGTLVKDHLPTLKAYGLATDRDGYLVKSTDGTFIEVFEWVSTEAKDTAHEHPAVAMIWEKMAGVSDFTMMRDLPEAEVRFPNFDTLAL